MSCSVPCSSIKSRKFRPLCSTKADSFRSPFRLSPASDPKREEDAVELGSGRWIDAGTGVAESVARVVESEVSRSSRWALMGYKSNRESATGSNGVLEATWMYLELVCEEALILLFHPLPDKLNNLGGSESKMYQHTSSARTGTDVYAPWLLLALLCESMPRLRDGRGGLLPRGRCRPPARSPPRTYAAIGGTLAWR